ncbi:hypothetical protein [Chryseobacterium potabilaquae]|uniref:DUF5640 domain-containing protein n=1 Tax=Chryseobacterium potabilaquae TaxID=2675057 RepID=A0A6N4X6A5_9FLAO|nr:hypothetical protein [Chryseobacterium potabilaquae]CAA7196198.1 hypothetical protein CHRY9293_02318 [Chryseobacterium potabilaquae]
MKKLLLLLLTAFSFIGCSSDEDTINDFIGTWSGTYEGNDKGVWNFVVANDGKVTGTMHSDVNQENYTISGNLNGSGNLTGVVGWPSKGNFQGNLSKEKKANGNWLNSVPNPERSGTWSGGKNK